MTIKRKLAWLNASLALTVVVASPALADDTELLLQTAQSNEKPNVLFILDSSASMNGTLQTTAFYDSTIPYDSLVGGCNADAYYWSDTGLPPACDSSREILNADFLCQSAAGQVAGLGSYTGVVAQYRSGSGSSSKWQTLNLAASAGIVECADDSGIHGDGGSDFYARAGTGGTEFTSVSDEEVDWTSYPTNLTYTLYDGNYLNWRADPPEDSIKRLDIIKTVLKKVLTAYSEVNIGLAVSNRVDGGTIVHAIKDFKTNQATFESSLDAIPGVGGTPISETFYETALYWQGLGGYYAEDSTDGDGNPKDAVTDAAALASLPPGTVYAAPPSLVGNCPRNFNILLTDALPTNDADTELLAPTLPGWEATLGRTVCDDYIDDGDCLDDISEYLFKRDISPSAGNQFVRTFGVGFLAPQSTVNLLDGTTEAGDGKFFLADDPESLAVSLLSIFDEISKQSLTFVSPSVAVNAFNRTQNLNDLYMTVFESANKAHWPGNVKKYKIVDSTITDANGLAAVDPASGFFKATARSFWSTTDDGNDVTKGGAAHKLPAPIVRTIYTNINPALAITAGDNELSASNEAAFAAADFGLTGATGEPTVEEIIRWATGDDEILDENPNSTVRNVMGDPLHSQPAAVDYGTGGSNDVVIYAATNDGYLHAIDSDTGVELWSFVPSEMLSSFAKLYNNPTTNVKQYGIDGDITPVVFDEDGNGQINGNDFIYIVFGLRRGGNNYYALDVKNPNSPELIWQTTEAQFGQSWSRPVAARILVNDGFQDVEKKVLIVGAGYDTVHDSPAGPTIPDGEGAGIFMLDLETGAKVWRAGPDSGADLEMSTSAGRQFDMNRSFPTAIKVIDINGDGFADRMYAADVGGQIWRFDIFAGNQVADLVTGGVIAQFGFEGAVLAAGEGPRRIYNSPDVSVFTDPLQNRRYIAVNIGSGYRAHPLNTNAFDRFYSLRDKNVFNQLTQNEYDNYNIAIDDDSSMLEISGKTQTVIDSSLDGWRFTLPDMQMVLADAVTFDDSVFFVGFSPEINTVSPADCEPTRGINYLYQVSVINGDPIVDNIDTLLPANSDAERGRTLAQGGIAPSPRFLFPSPDASCTGVACNPPPLGCVGVECFDPGFRNFPVRTLWTQDGVE